MLMYYDAPCFTVAANRGSGDNTGLVGLVSRKTASCAADAGRGARLRGDVASGARQARGA